MSKYISGIFTPRNPQKYIGNHQPKYRSSWELTFAKFCDDNDSVMQWASESVHIPYRNPFTGRNTIYVPDFLVVYVDKDNNKNVELIEIKPSKEMMMENAKSVRDQAHVVLNMAKWEAARAWCKNQGIRFRVISEQDIFAQGRRR